MAILPGRDDVYQAADLWKSRCLLNDGSVFNDARLWTTDNLAELIRHFVEKPDEGDRKFEDKLKDQLMATPPQARQLAAEMLWVMMLFPSDVTLDFKLKLITTVWEWSGSSLKMPERMRQALAIGIGSGGTGYNIFRPYELQLLIVFASAWKQLAIGEQRRFVSDGWAFADWFDRLPGANTRQLRHMLLHLLFPEQFERVASTSGKKRLDAAFAGVLKAPGIGEVDRGLSPLARDRRILMIRERLTAELGVAQIDFYDTPDVRRRWLGNESTVILSKPTVVRESEPQPAGHRVWVIGAGAAASKWESFYEEGIVAIGWDELGDLREYGSQAEIQAALKQVYERENEPWNDSLCCYQFSRVLAIGDTLFVKQGLSRVLGYGRVVGDYEYDASRAEFRNIRRVEWVSRGNWLLTEAAQLPMKTLTEVTTHAGFRDFARANIESGSPGEAAARPYSVDDVMEQAFQSRNVVEAILASLRRRKNVILQGPPGVGKSLLARRLAYALIGAEAAENVTMVQFHQSYAYEDFIQGWRPNDGKFALKNGVFFEFCRRAQNRPSEPHVFIIDEINRGNLSKVFGELMLLIEADKRGPEFAIPLTYSESLTDTFYIPENLYVIGLMNTADRSLAMVDYALRRRFAFKELAPSFDSEAFGEYLRSRGVDDNTLTRIVDRVEKVNALIVGDAKNLGPGFVIGHSYFCPSGFVTDPEEWYESIVREELDPLLREYWFDDAKKVAECLRVLTS